MPTEAVHIEINKGKIEDARALAALHKEAINQGFLSQLPISFLTLLYRYFIRNELVITAYKNSQLLGFISATSQPMSLFKRFLIRHWFRASIHLLPVIFRKNFLKRLMESSKAADKSKLSAYDKTPELLSIAAIASHQSAGVGTQLLNSLEKHLKQHGIKQLKVVAGKKLISANHFYRKNNFKAVAEISIHQGEESILYLKEL